MCHLYLNKKNYVSGILGWESVLGIRFGNSVWESWLKVCLGILIVGILIGNPCWEFGLGILFMWDSFWTICFCCFFVKFYTFRVETFIKYCRFFVCRSCLSIILIKRCFLTLNTFTFRIRFFFFVLCCHFLIFRFV